jgi:hypothetical protein
MGQSKYNAPTSVGHNRTAQRAANSDQFGTSVTQATTSTSTAPVDNSNIKIVRTLYTQPVLTQGYSPPNPPSQSYALPGKVCTTILHVSCHKGTEENVDFFDILIGLVHANLASTSVSINFIFNQIYQNNFSLLIT